MVRRITSPGLAPGGVGATPCSPSTRSHFRPLSRVTYRSTLPTPDGPSLATSYSIVTRRLLMICRPTSLSAVMPGSAAGGAAGPPDVGDEATTPPGVSLWVDGAGARSSTPPAVRDRAGGVDETDTGCSASAVGGTGGPSEDLAPALAEPVLASPAAAWEATGAAAVPEAT